MTDSYFKKWYHKNKEKRTQDIMARQRAIRNEIIDYKLRVGCELCGYNRCASALQFHHTDGKKEGNIAKWVSQGRSLETIWSEIEKCMCLCANCHAEMHEGYSNSH